MYLISVEGGDGSGVVVGLHLAEDVAELVGVSIAVPVAGVRAGLYAGRDDRSRKPLGPQSRYRLRHL